MKKILASSLILAVILACGCEPNTTIDQTTEPTATAIEAPTATPTVTDAPTVVPTASPKAGLIPKDEKNLLTVISDTGEKADAFYWLGCVSTETEPGVYGFNKGTWRVDEQWFAGEDAPENMPTVSFQKTLTMNLHYENIEITQNKNSVFDHPAVFNEAFERVADLPEEKRNGTLDFSYETFSTLPAGTYYVSIPVIYLTESYMGSQWTDHVGAYCVFRAIKTASPDPTPTPEPTPTERPNPDWFVGKAQTENNVFLNYDLRPHSDFASDEEYASYLYTFFDNFLAKALANIEKADSFGVYVSLDDYYDDVYINSYDYAFFVVTDPTLVAEYKDICKNLRFKHVSSEQLMEYVAYDEENGDHIVGGGSARVFAVSLAGDGTYYPFLGGSFHKGITGEVNYQKVLTVDCNGIVTVMYMEEDDALNGRFNSLYRQIRERVKENIDAFIADGTVDIYID